MDRKTEPSTSQDTGYKNPPDDQTTPDDDDTDDDDVYREEQTIEEQVKTLLDNNNEETEDDIINDSHKIMVKIQNLKFYGCSCHLKCDEQFSEEFLYDNILDIRDMDRSHRDIHIMNYITDCQDRDTTKRGKKRQRVSYEYSLGGKRVCKTTFMVGFDIGKKALANLLQHMSKHGPVPRIHGNIGKCPSHGLKFDQVKFVVQYISTFAEEFGLTQQDGPRGHDNTPPIYLPSNNTKKYVHEKYIDYCLATDIRAVKYSTFGKIWNTFLPHIKVSTPRDDACATCEKLHKEIADSITDEGKLACTERMRHHISLAEKERELYNSCIKQARDTYQNDAVQNYVHYTFNFCKHVCLPHHLRHMGPVYFSTPRKVQVFGFRIDGIPKQLNFLIDENETIGKDGSEANGPNAVISMVDWALNKYSGTERRCTFHTDNSPGQKNPHLLGYMMWRVMTRRHDQIEYMMQIPGHASSLVDSGFVSPNQKHTGPDCDTLEQLEVLLTSSSVANQVVRYPAWKWRDWKTFLTPVFKPLRALRQYQYFRFSSAAPGVVTVRKSCDDKETHINIFRQQGYIFGDNLPAEISPAGLSMETQDYLYKMFPSLVNPSRQDNTSQPSTSPDSSPEPQKSPSAS